MFNIGDKLYAKEDFSEFKLGETILISHVFEKSIVLNSEIELDNNKVDKYLSKNPVKEANIKILGSKDIKLKTSTFKSGSKIIGELKFIKGRQEDVVTFMNKSSVEDLIKNLENLLKEM
jgi:hypothetical protein